MIACSPNWMNGTASTMADRASAVTMPGKAIGSTRRNEIASHPKNRNRCNPNAASDPRISASSVAKRPAMSELTIAPLRVGSSHATKNQCTVNSCGGHDGMRLMLKA